MTNKRAYTDRVVKHPTCSVSWILTCEHYGPKPVVNAGRILHLTFFRYRPQQRPSSPMSPPPPLFRVRVTTAAARCQAVLWSRMPGAVTECVWKAAAPNATNSSWPLIKPHEPPPPACQPRDVTTCQPLQRLNENNRTWTGEGSMAWSTFPSIG